MKVTEEYIRARRDQIVDAAWACFARKGYHQTTMQEIAYAAGLSAGAIYRYYSGKEAVLKAINDRSQEMGRALVSEARAGQVGPLDALQLLGRTMLSVLQDRDFDTTARVNIEIWPEILRNQSLRDAVRGELQFWLQNVAELLTQAKDRGELQDDVDPQALAAVLICAWEGMRHYHLLSSDFRPEMIVEVMRTLQPAGVRELGPASGYVTGAPPLSPPFGSASRGLTAESHDK